MPVNITTAVDSLVELVNNRKKISLEEAANELGLPEHIVNEWAVFLEEENVLEIEYQFTTPFLIAKNIKQAKNEEEYNRDIEIILTDLEVMLSKLNKIEIKTNVKIRDVKDVGELLSKKTSLDNDVIYAQKFILEYQIKELIAKIKKLKKFAEEDYNNIKEESESIKKRKLIFDRNLGKLK